MFEKYGEFDSFEEINAKAKELMEAGKIKAVRELAKENGLFSEDAEDYINGAADSLCTELMAALGKINVESKDLETGGVLEDWAGYINDLCINRPGMAAAVRKKGKKLAECMALLIRYSFEHKVRISDKIVDITKVTHNGKEEKMRKPLYLGIPNRTEAKEIIYDYYMK